MRGKNVVYKLSPSPSRRKTFPLIWVLCVSALKGFMHEGLADRAKEPCCHCKSPFEVPVIEAGVFLRILCKPQNEKGQFSRFHRRNRPRDQINCSWSQGLELYIGKGSQLMQCVCVWGGLNNHSSNFKQRDILQLYFVQNKTKNLVSLCVGSKAVLVKRNG